jgi:hypothetical protein
MSDHYLPAGSTTPVITLGFRNASTGLFQTGITYATSGLTCTEIRANTAPVTITLGAGTIGSYSSSSIVETTTAGIYQFNPRTTGVASGEFEVDYVFKLAGIIDQKEHILLVGQANSLPSNNSAGNAPVDLQTIKTEAVIAAGAVTVPGTISSLTQTQVTGGAYALNTDGSGNVKISSGTAANQLSITAGVVAASGNWSTLTAAQVAAGVWQDTIAGDFSVPGSIGNNLATTQNTVSVNLNATVSSRMATYTQPTGFLAATFPGTVSSLTQAQVSGYAGPILTDNVTGLVTANATQFGGSNIVHTGGKIWVLDDSGNSIATDITNATAPLATTVLLQGVANGSAGIGVNVSSGSIASIIAGIGSGIAAAVWNTATSTLTLAGSIGKWLLQPGGGFFTNFSPPSGPTGANSVTINFQNSSGSPIAGVNWTVVGQGNGVSNTSGGSTFGLGTATGYVLVSNMTQLNTFAPVTFNVSGTTVLTVTGAGVSFPTGNPPGTVFGFALATDAQGDPQAGVIFYFQLLADPTGDDVSGSVQVFQSQPTNSSGGVVVQFASGWKYKGSRGPNLSTVYSETFTAENSNFPLPTMLG